MAIGGPGDVILFGLNVSYSYFDIWNLITSGKMPLKTLLSKSSLRLLRNEVCGAHMSVGGKIRTQQCELH